MLELTLTSAGGGHIDVQEGRVARALVQVGDVVVERGRAAMRLVGRVLIVDAVGLDAHLAEAMRHGDEGERQRRRGLDLLGCSLPLGSGARGLSRIGGATKGRSRPCEARAEGQNARVASGLAPPKSFHTHDPSTDMNVRVAWKIWRAACEDADGSLRGLRTLQFLRVKVTASMTRTHGGGYWFDGMRPRQLA